MGNFITYGVTEMLDNDQKFIIDSDRTGPGSITAKDAASSFLSKWSGFETFEEAVQNTISNNQEFIDRDTAIRSETAELKKKIVTTFPAKDASGAVATFESEFEDAPLKSCIVQIEPVQDLHGYDHPWPAGGGKNILPFSYKSSSGGNWTVHSDGTVSYNGTATTADYLWLYGDVSSSPIPDWIKPNTVYSVSCGNGTFRKQNQPPRMQMIFYGSPSVVIQETAMATPSDFSQYTSFSVVLFVPRGSTVNFTCHPQIEESSTPSAYAPYSNICPITGWTGCEVKHSGEDTSNPTAYPITFPTEAGTVYGAYVDVTGGELVVDRAIDDMGNLTWSTQGSGGRCYSTSKRGTIKKGSSAGGYDNVFAEIYSASNASGMGTLQTNQMSVDSSGNIQLYDARFAGMTGAQIKAELQGVTMCYKLADPIHYPLTPTEIKTLLGQNNIWADTGDISVEYLMSDVSWYVEKKLRAFQSVLAGVEDSAVASKNYSTNSYLIFDDDIYRVTKAITAGETIEEGVNVTKTTVAEQLMALAQA